MTLTQILENYPDEEILLADGFDDAVIGFEVSSMRLIYSVNKCLDILMSEGMDEVSAQEHFSFNVESAWVGEKTPIWCHDIL
jgi:hypothetical protein